MSEHYHYKTQQYTCPYCGWSGTGDQTLQGEMFNDGYEIICPVCKSVRPIDMRFNDISEWIPEYLDFILYPKLNEVIRFGKEFDKEIAKKIIESTNNKQEK